MPIAPRIVPAIALAAACLLLLPIQVLGFGNQETHWRIMKSAHSRFEKSENLSDYLREFFRIDNIPALEGESTEPPERESQKLPVLIGFVEEIDADICSKWGLESPDSEPPSNLPECPHSRLKEDYGSSESVDPLDAMILGIDPVRRCPPDLTEEEFEDCYREILDDKDAVADLGKLLRNGVTVEDIPNARSKHHFYDPQKMHSDYPLPAGNNGLDNQDWPFSPLTLINRIGNSLVRGGWSYASASFDLTGLSALHRALNRKFVDGVIPSEDGPEGYRGPENFFSLQDAERYLYRGLTATRRDEREHYLALHFIAVGHAIHFLQDMASPGHVRNDFNVEHLGNGIVDTGLETLGDDRKLMPVLLSKSDLSVSRPRISLATARQGVVDADWGPEPFATNQSLFERQWGQDVTAFWDQYWDQWNPSGQSGSGLAERVNRNYFSSGTVANGSAINAYPFPLVPSCNEVGTSLGDGADRVTVRELPHRSIEGGIPDPEATGRYLSSSLVPHLALCRWHQPICDPGYSCTEGYWEDAGLYQTAMASSDSVVRDYLELLIPLAVNYTEEFLKFYFRPRIEVIPVEEDNEDRKKFQLVNRTDLRYEWAAGGIEVAYDAIDGTRAVLPIDCAGVLEPAPEGEERGELSDAECKLPGPEDFEPGKQPDPLGAFRIVLRGSHGERGEAGTIGTCADPADWRRCDYVTAFSRPYGLRLLYGFERHTSANPNVTSDEIDRIDLAAIAVDPEVAVHEILDPFEQVLTAPLTDLETDKDFVDPQVSPDGHWIAFKSDLEVEHQEQVLRFTVYGGQELYKQVSPSGFLYHIYVAELASLADPAAWNRITTEPNLHIRYGGESPVAWSRQDGSLFYVQSERRAPVGGEDEPPATEDWRRRFFRRQSLAGTSEEIWTGSLHTASCSNWHLLDAWSAQLVVMGASCNFVGLAELGGSWDVFLVAVEENENGDPEFRPLARYSDIDRRFEECSESTGTGRVECSGNLSRRTHESDAKFSADGSRLSVISRPITFDQGSESLGIGNLVVIDTSSGGRLWERSYAEDCVGFYCPLSARWSPGGDVLAVAEGWRGIFGSSQRPRTRTVRFFDAGGAEVGRALDFIESEEAHRWGLNWLEDELRLE